MTNEMTVEEAIKWLKDIERSFPEAYFREWRKALDLAMKALEPKPMEKFDDVKTHIQRLAGDYKCWDNHLTWEEALELNRMLEAQPCEDCISREAVQDLISRWLSDYLLDETREALETINYKVGDMPSVNPERPKGKWIEVEVRNVYATLKCSVCGRVIEPIFDFCKYSYEDIKRSYPYCHCGAEMSGGSEDEADN